MPLTEFVAWYNQESAKKADERREDDKESTAEKEKGIAAGATGHQGILTAAKAVARSLAANGPVTIDDVVREMRRLGYRESDIEAGSKNKKNWKGSVFLGSEWVCMGSIASREKTAHGRHVRMWATKAWLRAHPTNGSAQESSAFDLYKIVQEARHAWPAGTELCLLLGRDALDSSFAEAASAPVVVYLPDGRPAPVELKTYCGVRIYPVAGVGAVCLPLRCLQPAVSQAMTLSSMASSPSEGQA